MKIMAGNLRGKKWAIKTSPHLRPTSNKVRKAMFDMLQGQMESKNVLDIFSGTGAIGFEALSHGAEKVTFVEIDRRQASNLKKNLENMGLSQKGTVLIMEASKAIEIFFKQKEYFDIIFLDPPYDKGLGQATLRVLARSGICHEQTLIFLECRKNESLPTQIEPLKLLKKKVYGDTQVLVYQWCHEETRDE